jgi:hypothetical protein
MKNSILLEFLGLPFKKIMTDYDYPSLSSDDFTTKHCTEIRSHLYGVSNHDEKLKNQIIRLILKGHIEQIDEKNQAITIGVRVQHRSEQYLAELKLDQYKWSFLSLQYLGQAPKKHMVWLLCSGLALSLAILLLLSIQNISLSNKVAIDESGSSSALLDQKQVEYPEKQLSFEELKKIAEDRQYVLLTQEELDQLRETAIMKDKNIEEPHDQLNKKISSEHSETITITIRPGMSSFDIANLLVKNGLARNVEEIEQLFEEFEIQKKIRSGSFTFPSAATYMDIIGRITGETS